MSCGLTYTTNTACGFGSCHTPEHQCWQLIALQSAWCVPLLHRCRLNRCKGSSCFCIFSKGFQQHHCISFAVGIFIRNRKGSAATVQGCMLLLCRSSSDILHTLSSHSNSDVSSSASSQWDVLQMLSTESQLVALLGTGDFIALPLGSWPHEANQVATAAPA